MNKKKRLNALQMIEKVGNLLPHPAIIFVILSAVLIVVAEIVYRLGITVNYFDAKVNEQVEVAAVSLLNPEGIRYIFNSLVSNFTGFAPLGVVLVAMLGVGVAEHTGLFAIAFKKALLNIKPKFLIAGVVFVGVVSNIASDAGYVVVIPLGGMLFAASGLHPIAGIAAAFAGVSGGFSANLLFGPTDALLSGITTSVLQSSNIPVQVGVTSNWYFLMASTFLITIIGTVVTNRIVLPNLGEYKGQVDNDHQVTDLENKGMRNAGIALVILLIITAFLTMPQNAILKELNEHTGKMEINHFLSKGLIALIMVLFLIPGYVYGKTVGLIKNSNDLIKLLTKSMESMAPYIVLSFFAAQFVAYFGKTNLGKIIAVSGANGLKSIGLVGIPLILLFILLTAFINLFIGSASAKWAIMAPIFVPMLYQLGIDPSLTQVAYRIADSSTNIISPLMSYFAMVVVFMNKYDKEKGLGTLMSTMLPYSLAFLVFWSIFLVIYMLLGLPLGPGL